VIRFWNRGAIRIFGFTAEEAIGASLDLIIPERLRNRHWDGYERVMASGETRYGAGDLLAVPAVAKGGRQISVEFTIILLQDSERRVSGMAAILRDVTPRFEELRRLRRELAQRRPDPEASAAPDDMPFSRRTSMRVKPVLIHQVAHKHAFAKDEFASAPASRRSKFFSARLSTILGRDVALRISNACRQVVVIAAWACLPLSRSAEHHSLCAASEGLFRIICRRNAAQTLQSPIDEFIVRLRRTDRIDWIEEARRAGDEVQPSRSQVRCHDALPEISRPSRLKDVGQRQRAETDEQTGIGFLWKAELVVVSEVRPPIDVDIAVRLTRLGICVGRNQDQFLLEEQLNTRPWPILRGTQHGHIDRARGHLIRQAFRDSDLDAERHIRSGPAHPVQPFQEQRMPQAEFAPDRQNGSPTQRHRDLMTRPLPQLHKHRRVAQELLAGRRERRAILVTDKKRPAELLFQRPDARADRRLTQVELFGRAHKAACPDNLQKGSREFDIQGNHLPRAI
jgi:PAS domain S-box-containing protein